MSGAARHARCLRPVVRFTPGDRVTVRGERWVVEEATAFADSTLLDLSKAGVPGAQHRCRLLLPFDRPVLAERVPRIRAVGPRRWGHHFRAHLAESRVHGRLRAAQRAAIDILPFQLEPALALIRGDASRFLLADEVGLGKTIQAGLMLAELRHRGWCDRAIIMTPPGLRQQWADELRQRFDIRSVVVDAASLSSLAASLPFDVNPWTFEPVTITSIDFIKQPEVLRALASQLWDLVIVDEAHQAAAASLRNETVQAVASRARHVVLVTATPHAGDEQAYRALCNLGQCESPDRLALFRRTREQAGLPRKRRAHLLAVRPTADAIEMHRRLDVYLSQLWRIAREAGRPDAQLVAMVLAKRAFSSAHSLARSLERRLAGLAGQIGAPAQPALPFDDHDDSDEPLLPTHAAFDHVDDERATLRRLIEIAHRAQTGERKLHALRRILRRVDEPVIVFTEYRDTLESIGTAIGALRATTMLHGGQTVQERRRSIAAFTSGAANLLLATDAGSEGLNLQDNCRLVVNLELPWNPIRLEQRIGRVDRIGQARTVHAINLYAAGTAEGDVLARLQRRLERIRMSEIELAACVITRSEPIPRQRADTPATNAVDLREAARVEAQRIAEARTVVAAPVVLPENVVPVTVLQRRPDETPCERRRCLVAFMRVRLATAAGRLIEDTLLPLLVPMRMTVRRLKRREIRATGEAIVAEVHRDLVRIATEHAHRRGQAISRESADWRTRALERERQIAQCAASSPPPLVQAGLFDTRALKQKLDGLKHRDAIRSESDRRATLVEADSGVVLAQDPAIALLLFTC